MIRILESALYVTDLAAARQFYCALLGQEPNRHCFYPLDQSMLLLFDHLAPRTPNDLPIPCHGSSGQGHLCLASEPRGIDGWRAHLTALGIAIDVEYSWDNGARSLYFSDPSGNSLEIAEPKLWGFDALQ